MKKVLNSALLILLMVTMLFVPEKSVKAAGGFSVSGNNIYDANGNVFVMRGINVPYAWYTSYGKAMIQGAAGTGANTVRVVLGDGRQYTKTSSSELEKIIGWCKDNKVVCILEVHDATGSDSYSDLNAAVNYWIENKSLLNRNTDTVIVNIANEWYGSWNGSAWADGYKSAISKLRDNGINNLLMVDCAGWGQYPDSIKDYGASVFAADSHRNTVFSIHMYEYAGGTSSVVRSNIDNALATGAPVVIGEFAARHTNGDVAEDTIMQYCQQKSVGYLGWSWWGNNDDMKYLDIVSGYQGGNYSEWGNTLVNGKNGIKETSKTCTVYTGGNNGNNGNNGGSSGGGNTSTDTGSDNYESIFWGKSSAYNWGQAACIPTTRAGGNFNPSHITSGGHFYVEYSGNKGDVELILQSWSGGAEWAKVSPSQTGTANGHYYCEYSYDNCVKAFGTKDFSNYLDMINIGAKSGSIELYSVCYTFR